MNASNDWSSVAAGLFVNTSTIAPMDSNKYHDRDNPHKDNDPSIGDVSFDSIWHYGLGLLIVLMICYLSRARIPAPEFRQGGMFLERQRRRERRRAERRARRDDPQYRQRIFERALRVQCITAVDPKSGMLALGDPPAPTEGVAAEDADGIGSDEAALGTVHHNDHEHIWEDESCACVICLEPFHVGDVVAWSRGRPPKNNQKKEEVVVGGEQAEEADVEQGRMPGTVGLGAHETDFSSPTSTSEPPAEDLECKHAFHRECIEQWLLKHEDCPYCRATILYEKVDDDSDDDSNISDDQFTITTSFDAADHQESLALETEQHLEGAAAGSTASMALVIINGLVMQVKRASHALFTAVGSDQNNEHGEGALQDPDNGMPSPPLPIPPAREFRRTLSDGRGRTRPLRRTLSGGRGGTRQFRRTLSDGRGSSGTGESVYDSFWSGGERGVGRSWWPWRSNAPADSVDHSASEEEDGIQRQRPEDDDQDVASARVFPMVSPVRFRRTLSAGRSNAVVANVDPCTSDEEDGLRRQSPENDDQDAARARMFAMVSPVRFRRTLSAGRNNTALANVDLSASEEEDGLRRQSPEDDDQDAVMARVFAMVSPVRFRRTLSAGPSPSAQARNGPPYPLHCDDPVDDAAVDNHVRSARHMDVPVDADTGVHMRRSFSSSVTPHHRPSWLPSRSSTTAAEENQQENEYDDGDDDHSDVSSEDELVFTPSSPLDHVADIDSREHHHGDANVVIRGEGSERCDPEHQPSPSPPSP